MNATIQKITKGKIVLNKELLKHWDKADVIVTNDTETIVIKKVLKPSISNIFDKTNKAGKHLKKSDLNQAIQWARKKKKI